MEELKGGTCVGETLTGRPLPRVALIGWLIGGSLGIRLRERRLAGEIAVLTRIIVANQP